MAKIVNVYKLSILSVSSLVHPKGFSEDEAANKFAAIKSRKEPEPAPIPEMDLTEDSDENAGHQEG